MERFLDHLAHHPFLAGAALLAALAVLAYEIRMRAVGGHALRPAEVITLINRGGLLLDVRDPDAFARGHIVNAQNVPLAELEERIGSLDKHRRKPIVTCCDSGISGGRAAGALRRRGFEQVYSLQGGLSAWQRENLPVVTEHRPPEQS